MSGQAGVPEWTSEVDVLVIGLGAAGACAAIEAGRAGATVRVVEKASFGGGTSSMSGGVLYCGGGTSIQKACGFEDSPEAMKVYLKAAGGSDPDLDKIDLYCDESVAHFDWLVEMGIAFKPKFWPEYVEPHTDDGLYYSGCEHTYPFSEMAPPAPRGHCVQAMGSVGDAETIGAGRILMDVLEEQAREAGAEIIFDAWLESIVQDRDGVVVGARIKTGTGIESVRVDGGMILATGGFIANRPMLAEYAPSGLDLVPLCSAHDDGSGIEIAIEAGGAAINMDAMAFMCPVLEPHRLVQGILFNRRGERFVTEDVNHKRIAERCYVGESGQMYLLVDDEVFCEPRFQKELIAVGESIEEIEAALEFLPEGALVKTVAEYNAHAAIGQDPVYGKRLENLKRLDRAPYGVFDCSLGAGQPYLGLTLGGLHTKSTGEVLRPDGSAMPGLYAAGRTTSCLSAQNCFTSGIQLGEGTFFGRLAGRAAAERGRV